MARTESIITRLATSSDIESILQLQDKNLYSLLSETQRQDGFVTTPFTVEQIEILIGEGGVFVAIEATEVIGYLFAGSWQYFSQWPIFRYMVTRFPIVEFEGDTIAAENSFQYGPICIAREHRGSGAFELLFECMRNAFATRYPFGYTFINKANQRSFVAHTQKLGLKVTDQFEFNDRSYYGLAFSTAAPQR